MEQFTNIILTCKCYHLVMKKMCGSKRYRCLALYGFCFRLYCAEDTLLDGLVLMLTRKCFSAWSHLLSCLKFDRKCIISMAYITIQQLSLLKSDLYIGKAAKE
jgi:hypothetical protein